MDDQMLIEVGLMVRRTQRLVKRARKLILKSERLTSPWRWPGTAVRRLKK